MNASKIIEAYYQEVGRAGRDGLPSHCYGFYVSKDFQQHRWFLQDIKDPQVKEHNEKMIVEMEEFANHKGCRRIKLLEYFGEEYKNAKLESKGFYEPITVQDFPLRGKACYFIVKRRRWLNLSTGNIIARNWNLVANGTRLTKEFADFLKAINR